jgi:hypothetical protein
MRISDSVMKARRGIPDRGEPMPSGPAIDADYDRSSYLPSQGFQDVGPAPDLDRIHAEQEILEVYDYLVEALENKTRIPQRERDLLARCARQLLE